MVILENSYGISFSMLIFSDYGRDEMGRVSAKLCVGCTVDCLATSFGQAFAQQVFPAQYDTIRVQAKVILDENVVSPHAHKQYRQLTVQICDSRVSDPAFQAMQCKIKASEVRFKSSAPQQEAGPAGPAAPLVGPQPEEEEPDLIDGEPIEEEAPPVGPSDIDWSGPIEDGSTHMIDMRGALASEFPPTFLAADVQSKSIFELFLMLLPMKYVEEILLPVTNERGYNLFQAAKPRWKPLTKGEFLRFLGYIMLMSLCPQHGSRANLWATGRQSEPGGLDSRIFVPQDIGRHGISRNRFEQIVAAIAFRNEVKTALEQDPLFDIRVLFEAWNANMKATFKPSWIVCFDESMSKWTQLLTMPGAVCMLMKPTRLGQECHDAACGLTNIIFVLEPVSPASYSGQLKYCDSLPKTSAMLRRMLEATNMPGRGHVMILDSGFQGLPSLKVCKDLGVFVINMFKKKKYWPKGIPGDEMKAAVKDKPLGSVVVRKGEYFDMPFYITSLRDRDHILNIAANCFSLVRTGRKVNRLIGGEWLSYIRPEVFETYVKYRSAVDHNNQARQGSAVQSLEDAWQTKHWQHRTFSFVLGVTEANVLFTYNYLHPEKKLDSVLVRKALAEQLLYNPFLVEIAEEEMDSETAAAKRAKDALESGQDHALQSFGKNEAGGAIQMRCKTCRKGPDGRRRRTTTYCACNPNAGICRDCFTLHLRSFL